MDWNELELIGADLPRTDAGLVVGRPLVRDRTGAIFVIRVVDATSPEPISLISSHEFADGVAAGRWLKLTGWPARRRFLTLVPSRPMEEALRTVGSDRAEECALDWERVNGISVAYADRDMIRKWLKDSASDLLDWAEERIATFDPTDVPSETLARTRLVVRQVFFLTDEVDVLRRRMLLDLAALDIIATGALSRSVQQLLRDDFEWSDAQIAESVATHQQTLTRRKIKPIFSPNAWSTRREEIPSALPC